MACHSRSAARPATASTRGRRTAAGPAGSTPRSPGRPVPRPRPPDRPRRRRPAAAAARASTARNRAPMMSAGEAMRPRVRDHAANELRMEVEERRDDHIRRDRSQRRADAGEVAHPPALQADRLVLLAAFGNEVDHSVERLERPPQSRAAMSRLRMAATLTGLPGWGRSRAARLSRSWRSDLRRRRALPR